MLFCGWFMLTWLFFAPMKFSNLSKPSFAAEQDLATEPFAGNHTEQLRSLGVTVRVHVHICCETDRQVGNIALFWIDCLDWKSISGGIAAWQMNPVSTAQVTSFLSLDFLSKSWWLLQQPGQIGGYHCSLQLQCLGTLSNRDDSGSSQA